MSFAGANVSLNADFIWNNIVIEGRSGSLHNVINPIYLIFPKS